MKVSAKDVLAKSLRAGYGCDFSSADEDTIRRALEALVVLEEEGKSMLAQYIILADPVVADFLRALARTLDQKEAP